MTKQEFSKLVREHGAAWSRAGASSPGIVFDPFYQTLCEDAQKLSRKLVETYDELTRSPSPADWCEHGYRRSFCPNCPQTDSNAVPTDEQR